MLNFSLDTLSVPLSPFSHVELVASMTFGRLYELVMKDTPERPDNIAKVAHSFTL